MGAAGILCGWELQGNSEVGHDCRVGHSRETLGLGDSGVGHSRETLGLGSPRRPWVGSGLGAAGRLCIWALQGDSGLGSPEKLWGWALQGDPGVGTPGVSGLGNSGSLESAIGQSRESLGVDRATRRVPGEERSSGRGEELSLKSNNPTPKVGKTKHLPWLPW